jgi:hypothetical protein
MNVQNLRTSLTTLIDAAVISGDLAAAPINVPQTVGDLVGLLGGAEVAGIQFAKDEAWNAKVATAVQTGRSVA